MSKSVLIVDDSASIRDSITFTLEPEGYDVTVAEHGQDGLEKVQKENFDLIITDLNMPIMNGFDFIRGARATASGSGIPS